VDALVKELTLISTFFHDTYEFRSSHNECTNQAVRSHTFIPWDSVLCDCSCRAGLFEK